MTNRPDPAGPNAGGPTKWRDLEMKDSNRRTLIAVLILIIVVVGAVGAALLTLQITPDQVGAGDSVYPYTTTYQASLPDGERVRVGSLDILAMQTGDKIALRIGDHREEMKLGETRQIGKRVFSIRVFGVPAFETGYQLDATWTGVQKDKEIFRIVLKTSRQVPEWLMSRIIPGSIEAVPA
ncbi:hypothetical protein [uncultured Methanospirillum sp.]|uniref:hypothetical protein n=1 Tax=uncultured Methanospirillum sp. TaxID=262503 RepID=UPI0029C70344|nr:hypothetical protein [uncultured Methanospirillum sp.]